MRETPWEHTPTSLDSVMDAVIVMDLEGRIVEWSPTAEKLFGWTWKEAVGRLVASLLIPDHLREAFWEGLQQIQSLVSSKTEPDSHTINNRMEVASLRKGGDEFVIDLTVTSLKLSGQTLSFWESRGISRHCGSKRIFPQNGPCNPG